MKIVGVLCFSDEILADVTEVRLALERKGYTVHLQQIGHGLRSMESGYYEEGSLVLWLGRCYGNLGRCREIADKYIQEDVDVILAMQAPALKAALEMGGTMFFNPGSEYSEGILRGVLINLSGGKLLSYQFVSG
jgi:hypothetical protein